MSQPIEELLSSTREKLISLELGIQRIEEIVRSSYNRLEKEIDGIRTKMDIVGSTVNEERTKGILADAKIVGLEERIGKMESNQSKIVWFVIMGFLAAVLSTILK